MGHQFDQSYILGSQSCLQGRTDIEQEKWTRMTCCNLCLQGRGMKASDVDSIGQGRVWAGTDAINIGLVDEFCGLYEAINAAADKEDIKTEDIHIKYFPEIDESFMTVLAESINEENIAINSESQIEKQLMEIYNYFQMMGSQKGVQARIPYLFWID